MHPRIPDVTPDGAELAARFTGVLRHRGIDVSISNTVRFCEALAAVGLSERNWVYWAGRSTLISKPEDIDCFDHAFETFWESVDATSPNPIDQDTINATIVVDDPTATGENEDSTSDASDDDNMTLQLRHSSAEVLRNKDFASYNPDELAEAQRLMSRMHLVGSPRRSLRLASTRRSSPNPDVRRTMRAAMANGGEPLRLFHRRPSIRQRRLILLLDISGSMEPYARALLRFVHAAVAGRQKVEAFAIGTRLTRLTRELSRRDPDDALTQAAQQMADYGGGTRLGQCLAEFNTEWGLRGMARGAEVVIMSDGWDRGDPAILGEQMARLQRVAHRITWVNPLKVTPGYAPLARGMAAALEHIDEFVEGHSITAIEDLSKTLSRAGLRRGGVPPQRSQP